MPILAYLPLLGGLYLGWSLGANNASNCFGTAVAARIISFRNACLICAIAVMAGAGLQGAAGVETLSQLADQSIATVVITTVAAGLTVTIMTYFGIPVSTSQAIIGAIIGIGLSAKTTIDWTVLNKIIICWIATPIGAMLVAVLLYVILGFLLTRLPMSMFTRDKLLFGGLLVAGAYGSYALGANNVAIATGVFSGKVGHLSDVHLAAIGGVAIALGVVTYSKPVMLSIGSGIMPLDAFTALVAVGAMALTVHFFSFVGVPVSTSQGIVGAIAGIGFFRRNKSLRARPIGRIALGWLMTPIISLIFAAAAYAIFL